MKIETDRLYLREMNEHDFDALYAILGDAQTMYAYEHGFTVDEAKAWLMKQLKNYQTYGYGLWAVILKETDEMIGQCGLTRQACDTYGEVVEIGYLLNKAYWHNGYATEVAQACKQWAFDELRIPEVFSIIRDNNIASQCVAERNGMLRRGQFVKHYYGIDMPHIIYSAQNTNE